ncbi:MAG: hypothetical protein J6L86_03950 [Alphaproteobacteria bacterium]|nr:hypothetical protein [Alphaproteobacteria bacterium]
MKMYVYTFAYDKIKEEGYKSLSMFDKDSEHYKGCLWTHRCSANSENYVDIEAYMERTFEGRLRSICAITEIAPVTDYQHPYLDRLVHYADVISFDAGQLVKDGVVEAVYCKDLRQTVLINPAFENIYKLNGLDEIDTEPYDWRLCGEKEYQKYSPWATIKHYMLVLKDGYVPPRYITLETDNSAAREAEEKMRA